MLPEGGQEGIEHKTRQQQSSLLFTVTDEAFYYYLSGKKKKKMNMAASFHAHQGLMGVKKNNNTGKIVMSARGVLRATKLWLSAFSC